MGKLRWTTFDAQPSSDGSVRVGVWDLVCIPGHDEKEGQSTDFNLETLSQMVDNFVDRSGDPIPLDANHLSNYTHVTGQPAPALAFYGALAVVWEGKIARLERGRDTPPCPGSSYVSPSAASESGIDTSRDGLWCFRNEVTEIGKSLLKGFKLVSPTFMSDATKRDGTPVGYSLAAVAATNTPWQSATEITFSQPVLMRIEQRGEKWVVLPESGDKVLGTHDTKADAEKQLAAIEASKHKQEMQTMALIGRCPYCRALETLNDRGTLIGHAGKDGKNCPGSGKSVPGKAYENDKEGAATMAKAKFAKFAGAADGADDAAIKSALSAKTAELAKAAMEDEAFKYDEAADELEAMAAEAAGEPTFEEEAGVMSKMAAKFRRFAKFDNTAGDGGGAPEKPEAKPKADAQGKTGLEYEEEKDKMAKLEAKDAAADAKMAAMEARLAKFERVEAERAAVAAKEQERKFEQLADAAIDGGYPKDKRGALIKFARTDFDGARSLVEPFTKGAPAHIFDRLSAQGGPAGSKAAREFSAPEKPRVHKTPFGRFVEDDGKYAETVKALAESKEPSQMAKVDKLLPEPQRPIMFNRLLAAQKIVRAEQPELAESAEQ